MRTRGKISKDCPVADTKDSSQRSGSPQQTSSKRRKIDITSSDVGGALDDCTRYVALLRGINVGSRRVKMDRLRKIFTEAGFGSVTTFIGSGNVIFFSGETDVSVLEAKIEAMLHDELGFDVKTFVRPPETLSEIAAHMPEGHTDDRELYVAFLQQQASDELRDRFHAIDCPSDRFVFSASGLELYWSIGTLISESPVFGKLFDKTMADNPNTTRNIKSLRRLVTKLQST